MKVVKTLSFNPESAQLLESLAKRLGKSQSGLIRELIHEKAKELGLVTEKPKLAQASP